MSVVPCLWLHFIDIVDVGQLSYCEELIELVYLIGSLMTVRHTDNCVE